jgi:hypothetical protein
MNQEKIYIEKTAQKIPHLNGENIYIKLKEVYMTTTTMTK